jgi:hypothetical protein
MSLNLPTHSVSSIFLDQDLMTNFQNGNNTFVYDFGARTVFTTPETKMSIANFSVPFSWFNITKALQNNFFAYVWYDSISTETVYTAFNSIATQNGKVFNVEIPDGYYTMQTLNSFLQFTMIQNGHYLVNTNGDYVYFLEFVKNSTAERTQINSFQLPPSNPAGYGTPGSGVHFTGGPNGTQYPTVQLLLFNDNLNTGALFSYFGFTATVDIVSPWPTTSSHPAPRAIPALGANITTATASPFQQYNILSNFAPLISQVHSICLTCSAIDNPLRSNIQHQVSTTVLTTQNVNVPFGQDIANSNFFTTWIPLFKNTNITTLKFQLTDQEGVPVVLQDADTNIELLISNLKYT